MRVLFTAVAGRPHLFPLVPLAWACRAAGHEVRLASAPSAAEIIVHTGLPAVVIGSGPRQSPEDRADLVRSVYGQPPWPRDWPALVTRLDDGQRDLLARLGRYLVTAADAMADGLISFARQWKPDVIVHDAITYAGEVAAQKLDIPNVKHNFGTATQPRLHTVPEYAALFHRHHTIPRTAATATIDPTPHSMRFPTLAEPVLDMRYVPYNGSGTVPRWLAGPSPRPRVCVTWGHTAPDALGESAVDPYRMVIDALAPMDVDIVVVTTAAQLDELGALPTRVRTAPSAPLHLVLPHCDAIVQQGGDGTTLTAAVAGIPQLAITCKPDAEIAPGRLCAVGAGIHLYYQHLRSDPRCERVVRDAVSTLLADSGIGAAAGRLRAEIEEMPPPAELVATIEKLG
ncbi:nucleotide disphospho-sugar-binding domain-containing protein [Kutzneria sp. NPDC052558]|uniref:nucleotide disphospho-sugar-binding domain-containing protein n=1 Tax=Kutzneria sp. NPDC052558 TaxID=3364121 RepID=UPI0037C85CF1